MSTDAYKPLKGKKGQQLNSMSGSGSDHALNALPINQDITTRDPSGDKVMSRYGSQTAMIKDNGSKSGKRKNIQQDEDSSSQEQYEGPIGPAQMPQQQKSVAQRGGQVYPEASIEELNADLDSSRLNIDPLAPSIMIPVEHDDYHWLLNDMKKLTETKSDDMKRLFQDTFKFDRYKHCWMNSSFTKMIILNYENVLKEYEILPSEIKETGRTRTIDSNKILDNQYIYGFQLSDDGLMLIIHFWRHFTAIIIEDADDLFDLKKVDLETELKNNLVQSKEAMEDQLGYNKFYITKTHKEIIIDCYDYKLSGYKLYQSNFGGKDLILKMKAAALLKNDSFSMDDINYFKPIYVDSKETKKTSQNTSYNGCELIFIQNKPDLRIYDPETNKYINFWDTHSRKTIKPECKSCFYYNFKTNQLYILNDNQVFIYYKTDAAENGQESNIVFIEDYKIKVDSKIIDSNCTLVKTVDEFFYFRSGMSIKIWNTKTQKLETTLKVLSYIDQYCQIPNSYLLFGYTGAYNIFYPEAVLSKTGVSCYAKMSNGYPISMEGVIMSEKHIDPDFNIKDKIKNYEDLRLRDNLPKYRFAVFTTQDSTLIYDFLNSKSHTIAKEDCGEVLFRNILINKGNYQQDEVNLSNQNLILFLRKENQLKVLYIPLHDYQSSVLVTLHTFKELKATGQDKIEYFYCRRRNEIAAFGQKIDNENYVQILKLKAIQDQIVVKNPEQIMLCVHKQVLMNYIDRKLFFNDVISNTFQMLKLDEGLTENKIVLFPSIKEVKSVELLRNRLLLFTQDNYVYITNTKFNKVKSCIRNMPSGESIQDLSNPFNLYYYCDEIKQINLFSDHPLSIPTNLMIKEDMFTRYDMESQVLTIFESFDKNEDHQAVTQIKLRTYTNSYLDYQTGEDGKSQVHTVQDVIEYIRRTPTRELLSYNLIQRKDFLYQSIMMKENNDIVNALLAKLEMQPAHYISYLFPHYEKFAHLDRVKEEKSDIHKKPKLDIIDHPDPIPYDISFKMAIRQRNTSTVRSLINLMVYSDPNGLLYQDILDHSLQQLIEMKVDIKGYLQSSMPLHQIVDNKDFPQYHADDAELLIPVNLESIKVIEEKYDDVIQQALDQVDILTAAWRCLTCWKDPRKKSKESLTSQENQTEEKEADEKEMQLQSEIEYFVVNLKDILTKENQKDMFMLLVQEESSRDITYLNIPILQTIIDFKWGAYTKVFYIIQFAKMIVFIASFIVDIIVLSPSGFAQDTPEYLESKIITRVICGLYMADFLYYEIKQMQKQTFQQYVSKDIWNVCDFFFFAMYIAYIPVSIIYTEDNEDYVVKCLQSTIIISICIKINFFIRIFDKFSFLVQMILAVFYDLRFFLLYFCIIISVFSVQVSLIMSNVEDHDGIGPAQWFVMVLRTSLGDNDLDQKFSDYKILFWIIWVLIIFVGNIVLMNFIIAVVSESYENCMQTRKAQSYKVKVDMIVEREMLMSESDFNIKEWFPTFIVVRRPIDSDAQGEGGENEQLIKEIHQSTEKITDKLKQEMSRMHSHEEANSNSIAELKKDINGLKESFHFIKETLTFMKDDMKTHFEQSPMRQKRTLMKKLPTIDIIENK